MTPRIRILMVIALGLLVCGRAFASDCAALEGDWTWITGAVMTLRDDQTVLANGKQAGTWQCRDSARDAATIHWVNGFVDSISVSGDRISGKNQKGYPVSAQRNAAGGRYSMAGANVYVQRKDWNGLLAYSQAWTQAQPGDPDAWYNLGNGYGIGLNQPQNALPALQRAAQLRTHWPQVWNAQGVVLAQLKRYREAAESFVHATEQAPNRLHYWNNLAETYTDINRFELAKKALDDGHRAAGAGANAIEWYNLGNAYDQLQQFPDAISAYQQSLRLNPRYAPAWYNLGAAQQDLGNKMDALHDFQQAAALGDALGNKNNAELQAAFEAAQEQARQAHHEFSLNAVQDHVHAEAARAYVANHPEATTGEAMAHTGP